MLCMPYTYYIHQYTYTYLTYISHISYIIHILYYRCIAAYFMGVQPEDVPFQQFRRHFVYELTPGMSGG